MRLNLWILLLFFLHFQTQGQNLVPNPSFEIYSQCPNSQAQVSYAVYWVDPNDLSSDYYNACSTNGWGVPNNFPGSQPARTGNAYMGIGVQGQNVVGREYITAPLIDTLVQGQKYCVEFYVSLCGGYSSAAIDRLGAYFSNDANFTLYEPIFLNPQIESPKDSIISDTTLWTKIGGTFIAAGGERFITIGCFRQDSLISFDTIIPSPEPSAYYYVDDVSVIAISDCIAGNDSTICLGDSLQLGTSPDSDIVYSWLPATGLSNASIANPKTSPFSTTTYTLTQTQCDVTSTSTVTVTVKHDCNTYPRIIVPSSFFGNQQVLVLGLESGSQLEIYDARGRRVYNALDYQNDFWTAGLAAGIYVVRLTRPNQQTITQKIGVIR